MQNTEGRVTARALALVTLIVGAAGLAGFGVFVAVSWGVLSAAMGWPKLFTVLAVVSATAACWGSFLVAVIRGRPQPHGRAGRRLIGLIMVSVLALLTGLVAVPTTRSRLEADKCHRIAAPNAAAQNVCRSSLEGRRQWWTLGLSHRNAP